jgi:hypothetical protein
VLTVAILFYYAIKGGGKGGGGAQIAVCILTTAFFYTNTGTMCLCKAAQAGTGRSPMQFLYSVLSLCVISSIRLS